MTEITANRLPVSVKVGKREYKDRIRYYIVHYYGRKPDGNADRWLEYLDLVGYANPKNQEQRAKNTALCHDTTRHTAISNVPF